jgi:hypothetical protein
MHTLKKIHNHEIIETFDSIYTLLCKPNEKYQSNFFDKVIFEATKKLLGYSLPSKIKIINELNVLLSYSDDDIRHATAVFRHINEPEYRKKYSESGHFKNLRQFWVFISNIFANDPQTKELIHWENPGVDQPALTPPTSGSDKSMVTKNAHNEIIFTFIPKNFSRSDIINMFPNLENLGSGEFGEDADMYGDTLAEVIENAPRWHSIIFNQQTIRELKTFLSYTDEEIDRASSLALIRRSPTEEVEEPPNWGRFPTVRAFWTAVLKSFENDAVVRKEDNTEPSAANGIDNAQLERKAARPVPAVKKLRSGMIYYLDSDPLS